MIMNMPDEILAWHFLTSARTLAHTDPPQVLTVGTTVHVEPPLVLCERGLHASRHLVDALQYAPGPMLCLVRLGGAVLEGADKCCAETRTILWMANMTQPLRVFARRCALDVPYLWSCPADVRVYLETGEGAGRDPAAARAAWAAVEAASEAEAWEAMEAWVAVEAWAAARAAARAVRAAAARVAAARAARAMEAAAAEARAAKAAARAETAALQRYAGWLDESILSLLPEALRRLVTPAQEEHP
jgi:hypothetical protein